MQPKPAMFKIVAQPTFTAVVDVPVPGGGVQPLELVFKHKTREAAKAYLEREPREGDTDGSVLDEIVAGWRNVDEPYTTENMSVLCGNFPGAPEAILQSYLTELGVLRRKN
ncbi:phage protein [Bordetella ansorpii]|uniref:Phage protein n=1 Tax=Bordetella ansorpii TaxID=288768 RepID=A0A157SKQ6_9BORD|nr:phage tail assembly chaperone [Bordetella ansorpii]SAI70476.1 phage protein [Bordetella ansorpii]